MHVVTTYNLITVDITLQKGVTILCGDSGTGKTLLMGAVELFCLENNIACKLLNYRQRDESEELLVQSCEDVEVVLIDNADLFITQSLLDRLDGKYVVVSLKDLSKVNTMNVTECEVNYSDRKVTLEVL